ncbi:28283_t:CDS:2 [Racocetra persica]|uniref:28283_t:CDS:1 n=1 Tax=Racocetra persica TaxID=160502 RepID=A0ACA9QBM4_9GLOM|nr:28283_t:CDS:2 [Racocetra persica]
MADGRSFWFSENNLVALVKKGQNAKSYRRHGRAYYTLLIGILSDIAESGETPTEEQSERKLWEDYLINLEKKPQTTWIKGQEEVVELVEDLNLNNYQPTDNLIFKRINDEENAENQKNKAEYPEWDAKINEIIGAPQPQHEEMTTEQRIEEFVAFLITDDEPAEKAIDNIHKIAVSEQAIYGSINGK